MTSFVAEALSLSLHVGSIGASGVAVQGFPIGNYTRGVFQLSALAQGLLQTGRAYMAVHTVTNPAGAVRAQVLFPAVGFMVFFNVDINGGCEQDGSMSSFAGVLGVQYPASVAAHLPNAAPGSVLEIAVPWGGGNSTDMPLLVFSLPLPILQPTLPHDLPLSLLPQALWSIPSSRGSCEYVGSPSNTAEPAARVYTASWTVAVFDAPLSGTLVLQRFSDLHARTYLLFDGDTTPLTACAIRAAGMLSIASALPAGTRPPRGSTCRRT